MKNIKYLLLIALLGIGSTSFAQKVKVAVAANLQSVIKVLQSDFKQKTGVEIEPIVSSSGNLVAQIRNGAPFDVFLSADMTFPEALAKDGLTTQQPVVYARGSLIICSNQDMNFDNWEKLLRSNKINKIAVANPAIAPYGRAAVEVLTAKGIYNDVKPKIVTGESISQVNTYISTGNTEVGFTTQALVKDPANKLKLYWQVIDPQTYAPIEQGMVLIKHPEKNAAAEKFYQYMLSTAAKKILADYGYRF